VVSVDVGGKSVTTDAGVVVGYDKLLVATGCVPRKLTVPGGDLPNVFTIRTVEVCLPQLLRHVCFCVWPKTVCLWSCDPAGRPEHCGSVAWCLKRRGCGDELHRCGECCWHSREERRTPSVALRFMPPSFCSRGAFVCFRFPFVCSGLCSGARLCQHPQAIGVTLVGIESAPFERVLGIELGASLQKWCEEKGLSFRLNATVTRIVEEDGRAVGVELGSGEVLPAHLVLAGVGAVPVRVLSAVLSHRLRRFPCAKSCRWLSRPHRSALVLRSAEMVASRVTTRSRLQRTCTLPVILRASLCG
jgi:hypothetical protein